MTCPHCGGNAGVPAIWVGNLTLCINCSRLVAVSAGGEGRELTPAEHERAILNPQITNIVVALALAKARAAGEGEGA